MNINNLPTGLKLTRGSDGTRDKFIVTIKNVNSGEVLYEQESFGGVTCSIEKITNQSLTELEGIHQVGCFGSILEIFYAIDQLNKWFFEHSGEFVDQLAESGVLVATPEVKEQFKSSILERMNRTWKHS